MASLIFEGRLPPFLFCKICNVYDAPNAGGVPESRQFKYTYFFYPPCVTTWNVHGSNRTKVKDTRINVLSIKVVSVINTQVCIIMTGI